MRFLHASTRWLQELRVAESTRRDYAFGVRTIAPHFDGVDVRRIRRADVKRLDRELIDQGKSPKTRRKYLYLLRAILEWAVDEEVRTTNPARGYKVRGGDKREGVRLEDEQCRGLLESCRTRHIRLFCWIGLHTGLRSANILGLQWDDVDLSARRITVPAAAYKTRREFSCPIHPELAEVLLEERQRAKVATFPYVLGRKRASIRDGFRGAVEAAGLGDLAIVPHDLRHTFSGRVHSRLPFLYAETLMGHSVKVEAWTYFHPPHHELRSLVDTLPGFFDAEQGNNLRPLGSGSENHRVRTSTHAALGAR